MPTTIVIVDDRELFREGFKLLLQSQPDLQVVGEASTPPQAYTIVDDLKPEVIVVATELDGIGGTTITRELVRRDPRARVLILSSHADDEGVHDALSAGARGIALKLQPSAQVFEALRAVAQGHAYLAPRISRLVLQDRLRPRRGTDGEASGPCDVLSRREKDVFELLVRGHTNRRIARLLGISPKTVETHRAHVLRKLGVHSIVDLIRFAARHQLPLD